MGPVLTKERRDYYDFKRWIQKSERVKKAAAVAAAQAVLFAAQDVYEHTSKNLKGPNYGVHTSKGGLQYPNRGSGTGKMPVP